MKMTTVAAVAGLLLCCFASAVSGTCDVNARTGSSVTLELKHKLTQSQQLKWTHNDAVIFERRSDMLIIGSARDIHPNGSLLLQSVTQSKGGTYTPEIFEDGKRKGNLKAISLCVLDAVPKPRVNLTCQVNSARFSCDVSPLPKDFTYEWLQNGEVMPKETRGSLTLTKDKFVGEQLFTCIVNNSVSSESSEPVRNTCKQENGFVFPDEVFGINTWIIVGVGGGLVVLLIVLVISCCISNKRRRRMQVKDEMELRLEWAGAEPQHANQHRCRPPGQQQHPNHHHPPRHHHHHQQQPAGHTGPRQHRSKGQPRPKAPEVPGGHPQPSPRRAPQGPKPVPDSDEQPPPLPQPRKKAPRATKA